MTRAKADWPNAAPPVGEARLISFSSGGGFQYFRALFMAARWIRQKLPPDPLSLASRSRRNATQMTNTRTVSYRQEHHLSRNMEHLIAFHSSLNLSTLLQSNLVFSGRHQNFGSEIVSANDVVFLSTLKNVPVCFHWPKSNESPFTSLSKLV